MKLLDVIMDWWDDRQIQKKINMMPQTYRMQLSRACDGDDPNRGRFRAMTVREAERVGNGK